MLSCQNKIKSLWVIKQLQCIHMHFDCLIAHKKFIIFYCSKDFHYFFLSKRKLRTTPAVPLNTLDFKSIFTAFIQTPHMIWLNSYIELPDITMAQLVQFSSLKKKIEKKERDLTVIFLIKLSNQLWTMFPLIISGLLTTHYSNSAKLVSIWSRFFH